MPLTFAPRRAIASARIPPPQPTSSADAPASSAMRAIQSRRSGLIWWSGLNSLSGSHQRCASALNFSSSCWSAFISSCHIVRRRNKKALPRQGFSRSALLLYGGTDGFGLDAAVRLEARDQLLGLLVALALLDRLALALALGVDPARRDAFADEIGLHRVGAAHRQLHVVGVAADAIGVPDRDDHFEVDVAQFGDEIVELGPRIGSYHVPVEIEIDRRRRGDLLRLWNRLRRGRRRRGRRSLRGGCRRRRGCRFRRGCTACESGQGG